MWTLSYRPEVEDDLVAAVDWYDRKQFGLGDDFLAEYLAAIRRVRDDPFLFAIAANGLRPCRLKRFSYIFHFQIVDNDIVIIAIMGGARVDPAFVYRNE